jgi:hypothetical protein
MMLSVRRRSIDRTRLIAIAALPRQGAIIRQTRRCLIANDGLASMRQIRSGLIPTNHVSTGTIGRLRERCAGWSAAHWLGRLCDIRAYPVAPAAIDFYKNGPSFMQRHLPLWLSVHAQRAIAVLVTAVALGLPMFRFLPWAYNWNTRRRLFYWYAQLKKLEASFDTSPVNQHLAKAQAEVERIEDAVSHIHFPLTFSDQLYNLRSHIEIVRRKITSHGNAPGRVAAE